MNFEYLKRIFATLSIYLLIGVIIIGILLFTFYVKSVKLRLKSLSGEEIKEQLKIPELQEELKGLPKIEMPEIKIPEIPEISEEELKKLEEQLKEYEE